MVSYNQINRKSLVIKCRFNNRTAQPLVQSKAPNTPWVIINSLDDLRKCIEKWNKSDKNQKINLVFLNLIFIMATM